MKTITQEAAIKAINETKGQIFSAYITKQDGQKRLMLCRLNVKKHLKGGKLNYIPAERGNIIVFDMNNKGYRTIKIENLTALQINNKHLIIK